MVEQLCVGMSLGVRVIKAVDIGEQDQKIRLTQLRHDGGQGVVIAQHLVVAGFDLGGGDGVVFVHHRDDPHLHQGGEGAPQVLGPVLLLHVVAGQKDLGHGTIIFGKQLIIQVHHPALAHGGGGLLHTQLLWAFRKSQLCGAHGNGAGGHQNDLVAHAAEIGQGADQMLHAAQVQVPGVVGQGGGAHLHDDTLFLFHCGFLPIIWFIFTV